MNQITFELDDALELALLQQRISEINQAMNLLLKKYSIPDGYEVILNPQGRWIGAREPVKQTLSLDDLKQELAQPSLSKVDSLIEYENTKGSKRKTPRPNGLHA